MIDRFHEILQELGKVFDLDLETDRNHACAIQVRQGLIVQLQSDLEQEKLLIISKIVEIPPGKFREHVLCEALKANTRPGPIIGIFAYIVRINQLVLFQQYPFDILTAERLAGLLGPFIQTAEKWRDAILAGHAGPPSGHAPSFQGMRP